MSGNPCPARWEREAREAFGALVDTALDTEPAQAEVQAHADETQ